MRTKGLPSLPSAYSPRTPGQAGPAPLPGRVAPTPPAVQSGRAPAAVQFKPATPGARLPPPPAIFAVRPVAQAKTAPVPVCAVSAPPPFRPGRPTGAAPVMPHSPAALAIQRVGSGAWGQGAPKAAPTTAVLTGDDFPALGAKNAEDKGPPMAPIVIALPKPKVRRWAPAPPPDPLVALKTAIGTTWDRRTHAGQTLALTDEQILNVSNWAVSVTSKTGATLAFNVLRGPGSGSYAAVDQLKIISIHGAPIGGKQPTYHITLS